MSNFNIIPLYLGTIERDKSKLAYHCEPGNKVKAPIISWYLDNGKEKILVDTGGSEPNEPQYMPYERLKEQEIDQALYRLGIYPDDIDIVILTHLHWDHASNNHLFNNAEFFVQRKEIQYAVSPLPIHKIAYDIERIIKTNYNFIDGDEIIIEGLSTILTPGHTPGQQSVLVDTIKGKCLLASDLVTFYECWEADPPIANGVHVDLSDYYQSFNKIKKLADNIIPGHDFKVFDSNKLKL